MKKPKIIKLINGEKLNLKNDGNLSLFFLGVGSAFSKKLYQNNALIIKGENHILIDCGTRCPSAFWEYGCPVSEIKNLLITHSHADHIGGLEEVALIGRYIKKNKPKMIIIKEYENALWEYSLKGGLSFGEKKDNEYLLFSDFFDLINPKKITDSPRDLYNIDFENINVKIYRTMHIPDCADSWVDSYYSYGILIDEKVVYTSDTRFDLDLINFLIKEFPNIEYIFHDCQLFNGGVHASYQELLSLPIEIRNKMYLTHYGDDYEKFNPENDKFIGFTEQRSYYVF